MTVHVTVLDELATTFPGRANQVAMCFDNATGSTPAIAFRSLLRELTDEMRVLDSRAHKKTDVENTCEFVHIGLLFNEPPETAGLLFI